MGLSIRVTNRTFCKWQPMTVLLCGVLAGLASTAATAATLRVPQDQKTIQAALDVAQPGDLVVVSHGTYHERIRMKAGVTLKSAGDDAKGKLGLKRAESTILDCAFAGAQGPGVDMAEDSTLDGFTVTGVGKYDDEAWNKHHATQGEEQEHEHIGAPGTAGVAVNGVTRCTVTNNIVHHIGYTGIAIMGKRASPHVVRNVTYRNMGGGIGSMKESTAIIEENTCFENFYAGIGHNNASPLVVNNVCYANIRAGIGISEHSKPIVRNNKCYKNRRAGIGVRTGEETTPLVEHNECYENDMAGIGARDDSTPIIRHNRCYKNAMAGIGCRTGARPLIEFNECFENKMSGIGCRLEAQPVIRRNRCWNNEMAGIGSQLSARPVIVENECFGNVMAGIGTEQKAEAVIRGNKCYKNLMAGIGAREGARAIIEGNQCYENLMAGIGTEDKADSIICNNQCFKNELAGIGTQKNARAVVVGNECRENKQAGIGLHTADVLIIDNRCIENQLVAIGVRDGGHAYIARNELTRSGGMPPMVAVRENSSAVIADNTIRGGGVAGVMLQGKATIVGNRFLGNGPRAGGPPNFAVWVHEDSDATVSGNRTERWRHAVYASGAKKVRAYDNTTSQFLRTAIVVDKSASAAHVYGNVALSNNEKDQAVSVTGSQGIVAENVRKAPAVEKEDAVAPADEKRSAAKTTPRLTFVSYREPEEAGQPTTAKSSPLIETIADQEMRDNVGRNILGLLDAIQIDKDTRSKVQACLTQDQWAAAVTLFRVLRRDEVHMINHHKVHDIVPQLLEAYLKKSIGSRIPTGDDRFTKDELVAMQLVREKYQMWQTMRGFVMPPLQELTDAHADKWLRDEHVMTRMMADRLIEKNVLGYKLAAQFAIELSRAGYPASLTNGPDEQLARETKKMLQAIDLQAVAAKAGIP